MEDLYEHQFIPQHNGSKILTISKLDFFGDYGTVRNSTVHVSKSRFPPTPSGYGAFHRKLVKNFNPHLMVLEPIIPLIHYQNDS